MSGVGDLLFLMYLMLLIVVMPAFVLCREGYFKGASK